MAEQPEIDAISRAKTAAPASIKIPEFIPEDPELWINQLEIQFAAMGVYSQEEKFQHLAANLPRFLVVEVRDMIMHQPADHPYDVLRKAILQRTAPSQESRIRQLLEGLKLGDKKPSQLLRQMRALAGSSAGQNESLLRQLWLQQLPSTVQPILSTLFGKLTLDEIAESADKAIDTMRPEVHQISQAHATSSSSTVTNNDGSSTSALLLQICQRLDDLTTKFQESQRPSRPRSRSRSRTRRTRRRSRPRNYSPASGLCWYHHTFGSKAQKCLSPCNYKRQGN